MHTDLTTFFMIILFIPYKMSTLINNKTKKGFKMNVYKKFVNSPKMSVLNHKWLDAEKSVLTKGLPKKALSFLLNRNNWTNINAYMYVNTQMIKSWKQSI